MSDTSTRSGMLWEVERILTDCYDSGSLPQVLLMENVPQVKSNDVLAWEKWLSRLEELGYKNYHQDLIATDYGIPQTRNRTFMISLLGEYNYTFPKPIPLKLRLKDMLEDNVDEKYYLSDKMINYLTSENTKGYKRKEAFESVQKNINENGVAGTITTNAGNRATDNFIISKHLKETLEQNNIENGVSFIDGYNRIIKNDGTATTLSTKCPASADKYICIKNATEKGYLEAYEGDGVNICKRMEYQRGNVQKDKIQTIDTMGGETKGVVVLGNYSPSNHEASRIIDKEYVAPTFKENHGTIMAITEETLKKDLCNKLIQDGLVEEGDVVKHSYTQQILDGNKKCVEKNDGNMITLTTRGDCVGVCVNSLYTDIEKQLFTEDGNIRRYIDSDIVDKFEEGQMATTSFPNGYGHGPRTHNESIALNTIDKPSIKQNLRIRKLTPKECFRLMGVRDEDYDKCAKNQSNASLYHLAGDSIVVNVLMAIFSELFGINWQEKI